MLFLQKLVDAMPMKAIWDESWRVLPARRVGYVDAAQIEEHLRWGEGQVAIADLGSDLVRLSGNHSYEFWKREACHRLVSPEDAEAGFSHEDYPENYCYRASLWTDPKAKLRLVLFERYH